MSDPAPELAHATPRDQSTSAPRWRRLLVRGAIALVLILALLASPMACTTRIAPSRDLRDPVTIYVLDHGRTPSLVLPDDTGGMIRYAYGDWNWYARADTGPISGLLALFWPTRGTLGRLPMSGPVTAREIRDQLDVGIEHLYSIQVERDAAQALRLRLDGIYFAGTDELIVSDWAELNFVPHPRKYTYFHNSNHELADWLRELGCTVRGPAFFSRWRIVEDGDDARGAGSTTTTTTTMRVPLWLKSAYTAFVLVLIPAYWWYYGPSNFLWFSDLALFASAVTLWYPNRLLPSMMLLAVALPELAWNLDFFGHLITGKRLLGLAGYMFESRHPLPIRALSLFHIFMPLTLLWQVDRLGYDRRALVLQTLLAWVVLPVSYLVSSPQRNINWVYGLGTQPQDWMHPWVYLIGLMILFPLVVYLPTHVLVTRVLHW